VPASVSTAVAPLRLELPERVHLEQVAQQGLQRARGDRLQLPIEVERRRQRRRSRTVLLVQPSQRGVDPIAEMRRLLEEEGQDLEAG
jgi:hypothetical protein